MCSGFFWSWIGSTRTESGTVTGSPPTGSTRTWPEYTPGGAFWGTLTVIQNRSLQPLLTGIVSKCSSTSGAMWYELYSE